MNNKLSNRRKEIDVIDADIVALLKKRSIVVKKIGRWKKKHNLPALDRKRWQKVLQTKIKIAKDLGLEEDFVKKIYNTIHDYSLKIENQL